MDEFEKAVIASFDPSISEEVKQNALAYTNQIKSSPVGWSYCLDRLNITTSIHVKFFCFHVFQDLILHKYEGLQVEEKNRLKTTLVNWLKTHLVTYNEDLAIKNKYAQIVVLLFKQEYPESWPTFFNEFLSLLQLGPSAIDIFLRILKAIDEEVVSFDVHRTPAELAHNTLIKDTMRDGSMTDIVESWYKILMYYQSNPTLINMTLQNIKYYVGWIDINLIVNDKFIPMFCGFLSSRQLREEVCDCFKEIINKGMESEKKLSLIQQLQIKNIINFAQLDDPEFVVKVGHLINLTGMEILRGLETLQKSEKKYEGGEVLLDEMLDLLFKFFNNESNEVSASLKNVKPLNEKQMNHITLMVQIIRNKMRYPSDYLDRNEEESQRFTDYRKDLSNLFRNIFRICPEMVGVFIHNCITNIVNNPTTSLFSDIEVSINLLFQIGEGISATSEETLKSFEKFFGSMIVLLSNSGISTTDHQVVSIIYFETVVRYAKFIPLDQKQYLNSVLLSFLDKRGIHHRDPVVRSKAGYLLNKLVKQLKVQIFPYINDIIESLKNHLIISYEVQKEIPFEEQLNFYESLGFLIGSANLPTQEEHMYLEKILTHPITTMEGIVSKGLYKNDTKENPFHCVLIYQLITVIGTFSKGFSAFNNSTNGPKPESQCHFKIYFKKALQSIILLPGLNLLNNEEIKSKTFVYMHRMVECLGNDLKPMLINILPNLLNYTTNIDHLIEFLVFINQLMAKYKEELFPIINESLQPIIFRIFKSLNPEVQPEPQSDEERASLELKRSYYMFIQTVLTNNLANVFTSPQNINMFQQILSTIVGGCSSTNDGIQKSCFNVIKRLIEDFGQGGGHHIAGFQTFIYDFILPVCFQIPLSSQFNTSDFSANQLLVEIAKSLKLISSKYGEEFLNYMATHFLPSLHIATDATQQFIKLLHPTSPLKDFQDFFKSFIRHKNPNQSTTTKQQQNNILNNSNNSILNNNSNSVNGN
eukprot:gene4280-5354_t